MQTGVVLAAVVVAVRVLGEVGSHAAARTRHLGRTRLVGCRTQDTVGVSISMVTVEGGSRRREGGEREREKRERARER